MEYERVVDKLRSSEALCVRHELERSNPLARGGKTGIGKAQPAILRNLLRASCYHGRVRREATEAPGAGNFGALRYRASTATALLPPGP